MSSNQTQHSNSPAVKEPTRSLWAGLVTHHRDIFVSHVLPKLNETDRYFFAEANTESLELLKYAGVDVSNQGMSISECSSISTLEWAWDNTEWGGIYYDGTVKDQAWFCTQVAATNKLEFLKWAREVKKCEWNEWTINEAVFVGNLEMLEYCLDNGCPCDEEELCLLAVMNGHRDCVRFLCDRLLFDDFIVSQEMEADFATRAAEIGQVDILKYFVEEREMSDALKAECVTCSVREGRFDCLKYMVEEAEAPLDNWENIAHAWYGEYSDCLNYLREKGCPEPTEEQYERFERFIY